MAKGGTTVDIGGARSSVPRKLQIGVICHQFSHRFSSATARPLATPLDRGRPGMLNSVRKIRMCAFAALDKSKSVTSLAVAQFQAQGHVNFAGAPFSSNRHCTMRVNWSSGMSYGGGGVAKGGTTVDIAGARSSVPRKLQIDVIDHQFSPRSASITTRPLATPFDRGRPAMLNSVRKIPTPAFSA